MVKEIKIPLCLQVFHIPPQTRSLFISNWEIRDPACSSHSPAGSLLPLKDWTQASHPTLGRQQTQRPPLYTSKEC